MEKYEQLQPREQRIVLFGGIIVLITLFFLLVWEPTARAKARYTEQLTAERALAQKLEQLAVVEASSRSNSSVQNTGASLLTVVDQAGHSPELGKVPTRMQPEGENEVRIWFEDVPFNYLSTWLNTLHHQHGITVTSAEIERRNTVGLVNARLTLARP